MEMESSDSNSGMMDTSPGGAPQQYTSYHQGVGERPKAEEGQLGDKCKFVLNKRGKKRKKSPSFFSCVFVFVDI